MKKSPYAERYVLQLASSGCGAAYLESWYVVDLLGLGGHPLGKRVAGPYARKAEAVAQAVLLNCND